MGKSRFAVELELPQLPRGFNHPSGSVVNLCFCGKAANAEANGGLSSLIAQPKCL